MSDDEAQKPGISWLEYMAEKDGANEITRTADDGSIEYYRVTVERVE